ncbi:MAG: hypothetical protein JSS76_02170 [Bacteroidetes bacterium]|nr:hypothetical protein [Bacteroidota bacterium]MBS1683529.1 hypothetical protein [Bacteroidota bacterium]
MKHTLLYLFLIIVVILASCKKKATISDYPSLIITSPTSGQSFAGGTVLHITGTATASGTDDAHLLHELYVTVKNASDSTLWLADLSVHDDETYAIDTSFTLPTPSAKDSLILEAEVVNHLLNNATQKVGFNVNP